MSDHALRHPCIIDASTSGDDRVGERRRERERERERESDKGRKKGRESPRHTKNGKESRNGAKTPKGRGQLPDDGLYPARE